MKHLWKVEINGLLFALMLLLTACTSKVVTPQPQTTSFDNLLNDPKCLAPCWMGIEVDKTSFGSAKEILTTKYGNENVIDSDKRSLEWKAHGIDGVDAGYVAFHEDLAVEIHLVFEKNAGPSVKSLVSILGEPTWIFISSQPHDVCRRFDIIYPALGLYGYIDTPDEQKGIQLSNRLVILRFLQTKISKNLQVYDGYLVKWDGYKDYCE